MTNYLIRRGFQMVIVVIVATMAIYGLLNAVGWIWLRGETRWLREYLKQRQTSGTDDSRG